MGLTEETAAESMGSALAYRLELCAGALAQARRNVVEREGDVRKASNALKDREAVLLTMPGGPIDGKNEEIRKAQLRLETTDERNTLEGLEDRLEWAKVDLQKLVDEFSALRAVARLFAAEGLD